MCEVSKSRCVIGLKFYLIVFGLLVLSDLVKAELDEQKLSVSVIEANESSAFYTPYRRLEPKIIKEARDIAWDKEAKAYLPRGQLISGTLVITLNESVNVRGGVVIQYHSGHALSMVFHRFGELALVGRNSSIADVHQFETFYDGAYYQHEIIDSHGEKIYIQLSKGWNLVSYRISRSPITNFKNKYYDCLVAIDRAEEKVLSATGVGLVNLFDINLNARDEVAKLSDKLYYLADEIGPKIIRSCPSKLKHAYATLSSHYRMTAALLANRKIMETANERNHFELNYRHLSHSLLAYFMLASAARDTYGPAVLKTTQNQNMQP